LSDKIPRLFIGPMSKEIVDIVCEFAEEKKMPLGLIPSRRQIENTGGYVNEWSTSDFADYVRSKNNNVLLVRDHGGPGQGSTEDDGLESLQSDISAGFDMLHIDPWKTVSSLDEGIQKTIDLIEFCCTKSDTIVFEVGTEEAIYSYTPRDLDKILRKLQTELGTNFERIKYAVVQSGVRINGTSNIGVFNAQRLSEMTEVCRKYDLISKEHNGDYLSINDIDNRVSQGLDCINIAPEFGVEQTRLMLKEFSDETKSEAFSVCKSSGKYKKWILDPLTQKPIAESHIEMMSLQEVLVEVSGHYNFGKEPFASAIPGIQSDLKIKLFQRFDDIIGNWKTS